MLQDVVPKLMGKCESLSLNFMWAEIECAAGRESRRARPSHSPGWTKPLIITRRPGRGEPSKPLHPNATRSCGRYLDTSTTLPSASDVCDVAPRLVPELMEDEQGGRILHEDDMTVGQQRSQPTALSEKLPMPAQPARDQGRARTGRAGPIPAMQPAALRGRYTEPVRSS